MKLLYNARAYIIMGASYGSIDNKQKVLPRNYHWSELPLINVGNSNVGNSEGYSQYEKAGDLRIQSRSNIKYFGENMVYAPCILVY